MTVLFGNFFLYKKYLQNTDFFIVRKLKKYSVLNNSTQAK
jgi:hypothetical protein